NINSSIFFIDMYYTVCFLLSVHDALPISTVINIDGGDIRFKNSQRVFQPEEGNHSVFHKPEVVDHIKSKATKDHTDTRQKIWLRSEEHTSELQSRENLVCRLLLEKKKVFG